MISNFGITIQSKNSHIEYPDQVFKINDTPLKSSDLRSAPNWNEFSCKI